jgi:hypothetical protein
MRQPRAILGVCLILALAGCRREIANRNLRQVRTNMSPKEVESILGQPSRTDKIELDLETQKKTMTITRYYYEQKGQLVVLHFQGGKLLNSPDLLNSR